MGFPRRWRNWVLVLLSTASTRILLNGNPGRRICHALGLRQGDPLSPLLFVLAMEVLNKCLGWAECNGLLAPIPAVEGSRVSMYADDVVVFVAPLEADLRAIKAILEVFGCASGLFSNLDKSVVTPMHCTESDMLRV